MQNKHTKGPWIVTDDPTPKNQRMIYQKGTHVLIAFVQNEDVENDEERDANAKLMASAPEMLEEFLKQDKQYRACYENGILKEYEQTQWRIIKTIIDKATL